jgi:uncharacterized repeat protein (TIGR02543 family)
VKNAIASVSLAVVLTLSAGGIGCTGEYGPEITEYSLTVSTTEGGEVTGPGEGTFAYYAGEVVSLIAEAESGYRFASWTGDVGTIADPNAAVTTITMNDNYSITANFYEIPATYYFEEGGATFPNPNVGATIRGDIKDEGYIFPSDLQRHTFFSGIT